MGKSIIIHHEQFSSRYTKSAFICQLFEITKNGHKDISSKIFGNLGGENLVLPGNKVYFMSLVSSNASGVLYNALVEAYRHIWYNQDTEGDIKNAFLKSIYEGFIDFRKIERNTNWKKNPRAQDRNDFTFWQFNFKDYAKLADEMLFCVSKPSSMSDDTFEEYLEPYGGRDGFDPRVFIYDVELIDEVKKDSLSHGIRKDLIERYTEALKYMLTSRSYFLASPVYIDNLQIPGLLFSAENALSSGRINLEAPLPLGTSRGTDLYRKIRHIVSTKIRTILDPERCIRNHLTRGGSNLYKPPLVTVINDCIDRGRLSKPIVYKLTKCPNPSNSLSKSILETAPYSSWLPKNSYSLQKKIIKEDIESLAGIEKSLYESAVRTANFLRVTYNSTTYLSRDLSKIVDLVLTPEVRWKGSRADKEKDLCQYIFLLKCILKTPAFLKELLNKSFYSSSYKENTSALAGELITLLTEKESVFSTSIFEMSGGWKDALSMQTDESNDFSKWVRIYINYPKVDVYQKMADECVSVLEEMVQSKQVVNSIEHGIQVCSNGSLFKGNENRRNYTIQKSCLANTYVFPYRPNSIRSYSYLEDVYFILSLGVKEHGLEIDEYVSRVLNVITQVLEIKNSVALKTEESYHLNGPLLKFLDASLWLSLQN